MADCALGVDSNGGRHDLNRRFDVVDSFVTPCQRQQGMQIVFVQPQRLLKIIDRLNIPSR